jgi:hypothetical protein
MSLIWPTRPSGGKPVAERVVASGGCPGVWMMPGETASTRMPGDAYSMAGDLVAARPPLVSDVRTDGALEFA